MHRLEVLKQKSQTSPPPNTTATLPTSSTFETLLSSSSGPGSGPGVRGSEFSVRALGFRAPWLCWHFPSSWLLSAQVRSRAGVEPAELCRAGGSPSAADTWAVERLPGGRRACGPGPGGLWCHPDSRVVRLSCWRHRAFWVRNSPQGGVCRGRERGRPPPCPTCGVHGTRLGCVPTQSPVERTEEKPAVAMGVSETPSPRCGGNAVSAGSSCPDPRPRLRARAPPPRPWKTGPQTWLPGLRGEVPGAACWPQRDRGQTQAGYQALRVRHPRGLSCAVGTQQGQWDSDHSQGEPPGGPREL